MKFKQALSITQTQKLIMTPELRQAINILQLPIVELKNCIDKQIIENPVLEIEEDDDNFKTDKEKKDDDKNEIDWEEYFNDGRDLGFPKEKNDQVSFEKFIASEVSLKEYLEKQLSFYDLNKQELYIAKYIIGNLDRKGYFSCCFEEVVKELKVSPKKIKKTLLTIQDLEPTGIGARNLEECLEIQLKKNGMLTSELSFLINNYINDISKGNFKKIAKDLGLSLINLQHMVDIIKKLDPKPGASYGSMNENRYIEPDVEIKKVGKEYVVIVNDSNTPKLIINNFYRDMLINGNQDQKTKSYIEKNINKAIWLMKSIEQRRFTLFKIVSNLLEQQKDFFEKGSNHLIPLTLKDVALQVDVHESTVSRVVTNKYVQTPRGLFSLKYFFPDGIRTIKGENVSTVHIKEIIEDIILNENEKHPYSDNDLSKLLKEKGFKVARRTVAKYRNELGILVTSKRKRY